MSASGASARGRRGWIVALLLAAAALRLALFALSPVHNAHDDHLEAIAYYATHSARPAADACWQCYQPPAYYVLSAAALSSGAWLTGNNESAWRFVQLFSVVFSLASLILAWRILALAGPDSFGARAAALAVLVFLPRDVYTAVFISNDAMLTFAVSLAIFVYLEALRRCDRDESSRWLLALLASVALAAFTKQHGLITLILPVALVVLARQRPGVPTRFAWLAIGMGVIASEEIYKLASTGHLLVSNQHYFDWPSVQRPGSIAATSFLDLRLFTLFAEPTASAATGDSYWTQLFARLWFDYDRKFLIATPASHALAIGWYTLGLAVSVVWLLGFTIALTRWRRVPGRLALLGIQLAFLAVPLLQTLRFPYWSSMKATFFLPALTVSGVLLSFGFERLWAQRTLRMGSLLCCGLLAALSVWELVLVREQIYEALLASMRGNKLWPYPPGWGTR